MNVEGNRLQTFNDWPNDTAVTPQRIAKAGFFFTGQDLEVECFACHARISEWNYGDQVMTRHRALNPECPFVINPASSGNVPITPSAAPSTSLNPYRESAAMRLASFENWPVSNIVSPERLARAGFYYFGDGDNTKCAFCKGVVRAWEPGDDPDTEHQRHFPQCPYVIEVINPRLRISGYEAPNSSSIEKVTFQNVNLLAEEQNLDELGVQAHKGPKRTNFATVEARLQSFVGWSSDLIQTPDILSQAGFYYEGMGDLVRCFHCDGGLRHWDPHDDPWTEHARWFPNCSFVKLVKGQEFVTASATGQGSETHVRPSVKHKRPSKPHDVTESQIQGHLCGPQALAALSAGFSQACVKRAIKEKLQLTGTAFSTADSLVEAALKLPDEEEEEEGKSGATENDGPVEERDFRQEVVDIVEEMEKQAGDQASTKAAALLLCSLENENRKLKEARLCKICMDRELGIVFLPCGHLAACGNCVLNLEDCPLCRCAIQATVRAFLS
ncbi:unnamed protein product [Phaedon cochleariae]|uniref:RING-type domain-containing protein n=1 Tax=Phaedon cochleariae TaxID=80249 RepID=A0A9P0GVK5_PHACE|nr:unnamed protein product [Phaedon cochleariae]